MPKRRSNYTRLSFSFLYELQCVNERFNEERFVGLFHWSDLAIPIISEDDCKHTHSVHVVQSRTVFVALRNHTFVFIKTV